MPVTENRLTPEEKLLLQSEAYAENENARLLARYPAPANSYPIDPTDGMRAGPTVERALLRYGQAGSGAALDPNWILGFESNASLTGHMALGTQLTVLGGAKYNALGILQRAAPLLNNKQYLVGAAETLGDAAAVFKSPTGATAQSLALASTRYGGAIRSLGYVGTAANIAEETAFVVRSSENGFNYKALGASATNVTGDAFATLGGIKIGAAIGVWGGPFAPITIPVGAALGGFAGHYGWDSLAKPFYRELWTGVPEPKE